MKTPGANRPWPARKPMEAPLEIKAPKKKITCSLYVCAVNAFLARSAWRQQVRVWARERGTAGVVAGAVALVLQGLSDETG